MSELPASQTHRRLRTWIVLAVSVVVLLMLGVLTFWLWLRSDGDLKAFAVEMTAAGFDPQPGDPAVTDPARLAQARNIEAAVRAISINWQGRVFSLKNKPPTAEFLAVHQAISSQAVCDAAREVIALGNTPIRLPPGERRVFLYTWGDLFCARLVVAEDEEFALSLAATRTVVEMTLEGEYYFSGWNDFVNLCTVIVHRMADRREQMRPLADWLESMAQRYLDVQPQMALNVLRKDLVWFRHGDQVFRMRGVSMPQWLCYPYVAELVLRVERESILREQLSWIQFLTAHPVQPRLWLDESERRHTARASNGSWLGVHLQQQLLILQHPQVLRRVVYGTLYARLLAAELRGSPWPIDLCDRAGGQLRRWEQNGRLIGAYSVGPDGRDDGGDGRADIQLRLYLDPPDPPATP